MATAWENITKSAGNLWMADKIGSDIDKLKDAYGKASSSEDYRLARLQGRDQLYDRLNMGAADAATSSISQVVGAGNKLEQFVTPAMQERDKALGRTGQLDQKQMDALGNLDLIGKLYAAQDEQDKNRVLGAQDKMSQAIASLFQQAGSPTVLNADQIRADAGDILQGYQADLDRTMSMVNSQGRADAIRRGMDESTFESDRQDDVVRKFAPLYMDARNKAMDAAIQRNAGISQAVNQSRSSALQETINQFNPELATAASLYRPRDAEMKSTSALADAFTKLFANERNYADDQLKTAMSAIKDGAATASTASQLASGLLGKSDARDIDLYEIMSKNRAEILKNLATSSQEQAKYVQNSIGAGSSLLSPILSPLLSSAGSALADSLGDSVSQWGTDAWNWLTDGFDLTFG